MDTFEQVAHLDYVTELFRILREADLMGESTPLIWQVDQEGRLRFSMLCSDTFAWGCADAEEVTRKDLPLLRECLADLKAVKDYGELWLSVLYCCRKREMRPMNAWVEKVPRADGMPQAVLDLILAAGPERESTFMAP